MRETGGRVGTMKGMPTSQRGFTLIELMIVAGVMVILVGALFAVNFRTTNLWATERERQSLQQNFRFASDTITTGVRGAGTILEPANDCMGDTLVYDYVVTDTSGTTTRRRATFLRAAGSAAGTFKVERQDVLLRHVEVDGTWEWDPDPAATVAYEPVTEDITTLAAVHFVRLGSRIVSTFVAQYGTSGQTRTITYTTQTTVRVSVGHGS